MIDVINLKKSFGNLHVLRGVNLSVKDGEKVLAQTNLIAENDILKSSIFDNIKQILKK